MVGSDIINMCIKQDQQGYRLLYEACIPYVYNIVKSYINDTSYQKDIIQETFAKLFKSIEQFDEQQGEFKYWIRKITVNFCLMHLRKVKNFTPIVPIDKYDELISDNSGDFSNDFTRDDINNLLENMPLGYKTIFLLIAIDGYSHEEVSAELNISSGTSRSQYLRAKNYIKENILHSSNKLKYGLNN